MHKLNISKLSTQVLEKYFECVFASGKILSLLWFREPYYSKVKLKISESRGTDSSGEDDSDEDEPPVKKGAGGKKAAKKAAKKVAKGKKPSDSEDDSADEADSDEDDYDDE